jgi:hypothetical protein
MIARKYEKQPVGERFDPFHDPYLADPYPFLAKARTVTPAFYSPDLGYRGRHPLPRCRADPSDGGSTPPASLRRDPGANSGHPRRWSRTF